MTDTGVAEDTAVATAGEGSSQPHGSIDQVLESGGMKGDDDNGNDVVPEATKAQARPQAVEADSATASTAAFVGAAHSAEGDNEQGRGQRSPRVGSVRQIRREKRRAGWDAKKALLKEKKKAEREKREEAMRKDGLEIPTAGTDYRALPKDKWSVSQKINEARRQEFEELSKEGGYRVCFDMAFHDLMLEKAQKSLVQQLLYAYGSNRKAAQPCRITLSGMGPVMSAKVNKLQGFDTWLGVDTDSRCYTEIFDKESLVYLTADAPHTITHLEKGKVYIIGGLVDRNAHKYACFRKATEQGVKAAKLPLNQEDLHGSHSKVLATNHVFGILLRAMAAGGDLNKIQGKALPPRKRAGWTGGDDRDTSSRSISRKGDESKVSQKEAKDVFDRNSSSSAEQNPEVKTDRHRLNELGKVGVMLEGSAEKADGGERNETAKIPKLAGEEKSKEGKAKVARESEAQDNKQSVVEGDDQMVDADRSGSGTGSSGGVRNATEEGEQSKCKREVENAHPSERGVDNLGEGKYSSVPDSKRRKAETEGDDVL